MGLSQVSVQLATHQALGKVVGASCCTCVVFILSSSVGCRVSVSDGDVHCCRLGSGSECGGGGSGGGAPAPQSARVSSNGAGGMAVSRVPSPLHDGNTPVAENWCFTQVIYPIIYHIDDTIRDASSNSHVK